MYIMIMKALKYEDTMADIFKQIQLCRGNDARRRDSHSIHPDKQIVN